MPPTAAIANPHLPHHAEHHRHEQGDHKHEHQHEHQHDHDHSHHHQHGGDEHQHDRHLDCTQTHTHATRRKTLRPASCMHGHAHGHDHDHDGWRKYLPHSHGLDARLQADTRSLQIALFIQCSSFLTQLIGGYFANSSILVLEAVHSALDGLTVVISLLSVTVATRAPTARYTYGFARAEVVSALVSVIALVLLCVKLFVGAVTNLLAIASGKMARREVEGGIIMAAEGLTLLANGFIVVVLTRGSNTLNIRALRAHVVADSVENIVVLLAGLVISVRKDWSIIDPLLTLVIVVVIVALNWGIAREAVSVLLQAAPDTIDVERDVGLRVADVRGVYRLGPVHVWTLTAGSVVGSAVVYMDDKVVEEEGGMGMERVRREVAKVFRKVGVTEVVVQVCCEETEDDLGAGTGVGSDGEEMDEVRWKRIEGNSNGYLPVGSGSAEEV